MYHSQLTQFWNRKSLLSQTKVQKISLSQPIYYDIIWSVLMWKQVSLISCSDNFLKQSVFSKNDIVGNRKKNKKLKWKWYFFFYQNCSDLLWEKYSSDWEKLLKFQGWMQRICKIFDITRTISLNSERSEQCLVTECFFNLFLEVSQI